MASFNLVDEEWMPCIYNGKIKHFSLQEILEKAHEVKEIFDPSPLVTVSLHRLLLAILHRNFGPANEKEWQMLWQGGNGKFDEHRLSAYFHEWQDVKHRFDLFDEKCPFYQSNSLPVSCTDSKGKLKSYSKSVANLIHELATGNNATLFDHTVEDKPQAISPMEAAQLLVTFQAFAVGGLLTFEVGQDPKLYKSADNALLVKGAVILVKGANLFQTLMLNFHRYSREHAEPFETDSADIPAWELDQDNIAIDRLPKGYLDLLTWQSRRIRLIPEKNEAGQTIIKTVVIMKGNQFPEGFSLHGKETMLAFHKINKPAKGQKPWLPVAFREERALWRDSTALFQSIPDMQSRPKTLEWLYDLVFNDIIEKSSTYDLSVMGLVTDRAIISLWRHEQLPLPLRYLQDEELIEALKEALEFAESIGGNGGILNNSAWNLAKLVVAPNADRLNDQQAKEANNLADHLSITRPYWSRLGISFNELLRKLLEDRIEEAGQVEYGKNTRPWWAAEVRKAAKDAFQDTTRSLDRTARMLKAVTLAETIFNAKLKQEVESFLKISEEVNNE